MEEERSGDILGMSKERVTRACSLSMEAHKSTGDHGYIKEENETSREVVFAFSGSWRLEDWFVQEPFGETTIDLEMFPCLKRIGSDEAALVNKAFLARFANTCFNESSKLQNEIDEAVVTGKNIVFAGHSSGGPMAILTTIWFLENYKRRGSTDDLFKYRCLTFGSPLVGNHIFPHALNRQGWAPCFIHLVGRYDIVPRIMLAPLSSIEEDLKAFLHTVDPTSETYTLAPFIPVPLFISILKNASSVASHAACQLMDVTDFQLKTISSFIKLSPYRPLGRYAFLTGEKIVVVNNLCAALQILFYSLQPNSESEVTEFIHRCSRTDYENELTEIFQQTQNLVHLHDLMKVIPLSLSGNMSDEMITINKALIDLGLGARARLCLLAAGKVEEQKKKNREAIHSKMKKINEILCKVHNYKRTCERREEGYYDAFKNHKNYTDCQANIDRLKLSGEWDEIIEMLKKNELPDEFETESEWVDLGTEYRRLVEPLSISNFYRHGKNELTTEYEKVGARAKHYRYTQSWLEHAKMLKNGSSSETTFWARVEVMKRKPSSMFAEMEEKIVALEKEAFDLVRNKELGEDVFLENSTFVEWWKTLPRDHQMASCLKDYMSSFIQE